jgi:hypothetical protein
MPDLTRQYKIDFIVLGTSRCDIRVIPQFVDTASGKLVVNDGQKSIAISDEAMIQSLVDAIRPTIETALASAEELDQPPRPASPAIDAVVIDGKEVRPALAAIPAQPATYKKVIEPGANLSWT